MTLPNETPKPHLTKQLEDICINCWQDLVIHHPRNLRCPRPDQWTSAQIPWDRKTMYKAKPESVYWNPYNRVVCDHRDGTIYQVPTDIERAKRGLQVPWSSELANLEIAIPSGGTQ
jgi:hypothetical protein